MPELVKPSTQPETASTLEQTDSLSRILEIAESVDAFTNKLAVLEQTGQKLKSIVEAAQLEKNNPEASTVFANLYTGLTQSLEKYRVALPQFKEIQTEVTDLQQQISNQEKNPEPSFQLIADLKSKLGRRMTSFEFKSKKLADAIAEATSKMQSLAVEAQNQLPPFVQEKLKLKSSLTDQEISSLTEDMSFNELVGLTDFLLNADQVKVLQATTYGSSFIDIRDQEPKFADKNPTEVPQPLYLMADQITDRSKNTRAFSQLSNSFRRGYSLKLRKDVGIKYVVGAYYLDQDIQRDDPSINTQLPKGNREGIAHAKIDALGNIKIYDQFQLARSDASMPGTFLILEYRNPTTSPTLSELLANDDNGITSEKMNGKVVFKPDRILTFLNNISPTLTQMEAKKNYHNDIKPSNIFISNEQGDALADFGLSNNVLGEKNTSGTLGYFAPERLGVPLTSTNQINPDQKDVAEPETQPKIDIRSDLYSLGLVIYEMITGERLFSVDRDNYFSQLDQFRDTLQPDYFKNKPLLIQYCEQHKLSVDRVSQFFSSVLCLFADRVKTVADFKTLAVQAFTTVQTDS